MKNTILAKPVIYSNSSVFNNKSGFGKKNLCDFLTFTAGTACAYSCQYCYVNAMVGRRKYVKDALATLAEESGSSPKDLREVVIRRSNPIEKLERALGDRFMGPKWKGKVIYASPLVDVAATGEMAAETVEMCRVILERSSLDIRLLSKSPLIESHVARELDADAVFQQKARKRIIFGISTGTLNEQVSRAIEPNAPSLKRRIEAITRLQADNWRTFGMLCPILPQDPAAYAQRASELLELKRFEHVWAEVLNTRGDSMARTIAALDQAGLSIWGDALREISGKGARTQWETYARGMFEELIKVVPARHDGPRLQFLQYACTATEAWWKARISFGAVVL